MRQLLVLILIYGSIVPALAVPLRVASFNIKDGFGAPGTSSYDSAKAVIQRVSPDVVAIIEATGSDTQNFGTMATELGYTYQITSGQSTLDTSLRTGFFSRYPFAWSVPISSPEGALEMTRNNLAVKIDVPGTDLDPVVVAVHYKCCSSTSSFNEGFRRAIEIRRTVEFLQNFTSTSTDNLLVIGDFNLVGTDGTTYADLPSGLPLKYVLGSDVSFPVNYRTNPDSYFAGIGMNKLPITQVNGATWTYTSGTYTSGSTLDYFVASSAMRSRFFETEVYNSALDGIGVGLPKSGPLPEPSVSAGASDHLLLFGDFELDRSKPTVVQAPTASTYIFQGQAIASTGLSGGSANVGGIFTWQSPSRLPVAGTSFERVLFTPTDSSALSPVSLAASVTTLAWGQGGLTHNLQWPATMQISAAEQGTVFAQIYIPGWTEGVGKIAPNVVCWIGISGQNTDPATWAESAWVEASLNGSQGSYTDRDEYRRVVSGTETGFGTFYYASRWQIHGGTYGYGGIQANGASGGAWDGSIYANGVLTVGSTLGSWSSNVAFTSELLLKYAVGGASGPNAANGVSPTYALSEANLVLTAIVRVDDPKLTVVGEAVTDLANYAPGSLATTVVGSAAGVDQTGVPVGCEKQNFKVLQGTDTRKFLRVKATWRP